METQQNQNASGNHQPEFIMPTQFVYHEDPIRHYGWLAVPRAALKVLNLEEKISNESYQHEDMVYLEEDQDLFTFAKAYLAYFGKTPSEFASFPYTRQSDGEWSPIRDYEPYKSK